jgi:hypothetical protein
VSPVVGEPTRKAEGTVISEGLVLLGDPTWRGEGTPCMIGDRISVRVGAACAGVSVLHSNVCEL